MPELPADVFARVQELCEAGDSLAEAEDYPGALAKFQAAWEALPEPREDWSATLWLLGAIGDVHYLRGAFADGKAALTDAMAVFPEASTNPIWCLRLGQCHLELGNEDEARHWLSAARDTAGDEADELFEEEDPKYLAFLESPPNPQPSVEEPPD